MFTLQQIQAEHAKMRSGADYPSYVRSIISLGVTHYDVLVADGTHIYYGNDQPIESAPGYSPVFIASRSSQPALSHAITIHQQGQTDFPTFCKMAASAGVEKWTADLKNRTVTYLGRHNTPILMEPIPSA